MATISRAKTWVDTDVLTAADLNGEFNTIYNEFNGNITNANIKAAAGIAGSKIDLSGGTGAISTTGQITSTLADGTSPFAITSTTVNTNLNADTVDGVHAVDLTSGWSVAGTFTYASASTITVASGAASIYQVGDKIKFTQTTAKYFYITVVADTLLTVNGAGLYTVANAAITSPYYSHQASPLGFPIKMIPGYSKARVYLTADQDNMTASTWTKIALDTESYDTGSDFASNYFTVPVTGYYKVCAQIYWELTDTGIGQYAAAIYVDPLGVGSPAGVLFAATTLSSATKDVTNYLGDIIYLVATDRVYLYGWNDVNATSDIESGAAYTFVAIELISVI